MLFVYFHFSMVINTRFIVIIIIIPNYYNNCKIVYISDFMKMKNCVHATNVKFGSYSLRSIVKKS